MNKILMLVLPEKVYTYLYDEKNNFKPVYINGEDYFEWNYETSSSDLQELGLELLDIFNLENTSSLCFDLVFHKVKTDVLKPLTDTLTPCKSYQIRDFENLLPELLIAMNALQLGKTTTVSFGDTNKCISLDDSGYIRVDDIEGKGNLEILHSDIFKVLNKNYKHLLESLEHKLNKAELKNVLDENSALQAKILDLQEELNEKKETLSSLSKEIEDYKVKSINISNSQPTSQLVERKVYTDESFFEFNKSSGTITSYSKDGPKDVVIPREIAGIRVISIGDKAFSYRNLTSIQFHRYITSIRHEAFSNNNLTSIILPDYISYIGSGAFSQNNLTNIVLPRSVSYIGDNAFSKNNLTSVEVPSRARVNEISSFDSKVEVFRY